MDKSEVGGILAAVKDSWLQLESDPGVFTLLTEDMGVRNIEVKEIFGLADRIDATIYGVIYLYKIDEDGESMTDSEDENKENKMPITDEDFVNNRIFFAHQVVRDSCATHALLNILLNVDPSAVNIGQHLRDFHKFARGMTPADKGILVNNCNVLAMAHNRQAKWIEQRAKHREFAEEVRKNEVMAEASKVQQIKRQASGGNTATKTKPAVVTTNGTASTSKDSTDEYEEQFHYCCFVPIHGRLIELDSLEDHPFDHGALPEDGNWYAKCRDVLTMRTDPTINNHLLYSVMVVVDCKRDQLVSSLVDLDGNISDEQKSIQQVKLERLRTPVVNGEHTKPTVQAISTELGEFVGPKISPSYINREKANHNGGVEVDLLVGQLVDLVVDSEHPPPLLNLDQLSPDSSATGGKENTDGEGAMASEVSSASSDDETDDYRRCEQPDDVNFNVRRSIKAKSARLAENERQRTSLSTEMKSSFERYREFVRDSMRRRHNYQPFLTRFVELLDENNLIENDNNEEPKCKTKKIDAGKN